MTLSSHRAVVRCCNCPAAADRGWLWRLRGYALSERPGPARRRVIDGPGQSCASPLHADAGALDNALHLQFRAWRRSTSSSLFRASSSTPLEKGPAASPWTGAGLPRRAVASGQGLQCLDRNARQGFDNPAGRVTGPLAERFGFRVVFPQPELFHPSVMFANVRRYVSAGAPKASSGAGWPDRTPPLATGC